MGRASDVADSMRVAIAAIGAALSAGRGKELHLLHPGRGPFLYR